MTESVEVRTELVEALRLDLIGPSNDHAYAREVLPDKPQQWYATGFLVPVEAQGDDRADPDANEEDIDGGDGKAVSESVSDRVPPAKSTFPSSMGLTFLVPKDCHEVDVTVEWGEYRWVGKKRPLAAQEGEEELEPDSISALLEADDAPAASPGMEHLPAGMRGYARIPRSANLMVSLDVASADLFPVKLENEDAGLVLDAIVRSVEADILPNGCRLVSLFLVNRRMPASQPARGHEPMVFQASLKVRCPQGFLPRPDLRGSSRHERDSDENLADLHYRDCYEFAVGHGISAAWNHRGDLCTEVRTEWMPEATVERVEPAQIEGAMLSMRLLGTLSDAAQVSPALGPVITQYQAWIEAEKLKCGAFSGTRKKTAEALIEEAETACTRMKHGIGLLERDAQVLKAFAIANRAMARAAEKRRPGSEPLWRPFQLAFVLLNLDGTANPESPDRTIVDLLFFPTGGGKTEAYLGLAAFALVLRRLRHPETSVNGTTIPRYAGVTVLMRYTLRLLTLDQMGRAAALMCALELERDENAELGSWPFEIGLWVGSAATPNKLDGKGGDTAKARVRAYQAGHSKLSPIPIGKCPWCGQDLSPSSFHLEKQGSQISDLRVICQNPSCEFNGDRDGGLPIVAVDETVYRRLPGFLLATVDKYAALPWVGEAGSLFGKVDRYQAGFGFSGPGSESHQGVSLSDGLLPPELVIQDELHLISGPLGTVAGLYEIAIERLGMHAGYAPKILASTATVRRAREQIRGLFGRSLTGIFPPQGVDRTDSFFAQTVPVDRVPGRQYLGIAAPGRSFKVLQMRVARSLMAASFTLWKRHQNEAANPADPYVTLLGYFNALRELGGFRRIAEDEIHTMLRNYKRRKRNWADEGSIKSFVDRFIEDEVLELTSRVSTSQVSQTKVRLEAPFQERKGVDIALATNMISVGLDISRLGLMTVHGQPKSSAEYIQATSRVGRDPKKPGLVVTMLNVYKPRDRSHYEHFTNWHQTFYRSVEPTSVTPFSPRALDRALVGSLIGLARHFRPELVPTEGAQKILVLRQALEALEEVYSDRVHKARPVDSQEDLKRLADRVASKCKKLLDDWEKIAHGAQERNGLKYQSGEHLLYDPLDPALRQLGVRERQFKAARSMRDVEPSVNVWVTK